MPWQAFIPRPPPDAYLPVSVSAEKRSSGSREGAIEIELSNDVRVRVDATVDEAALGRVLRALGR